MSMHDILWNILMTDALIFVVTVCIIIVRKWHESDTLEHDKKTVLFKVVNVIFTVAMASAPFAVLGVIWV